MLNLQRESHGYINFFFYQIMHWIFNAKGCGMDRLNKQVPHSGNPVHVTQSINYIERDKPFQESTVMEIIVQDSMFFPSFIKLE